MSTRTTAHRAEEERRRKVNEVRRREAEQLRRRRRMVAVGWAAGLLAVVAAVTFMLVTSQPVSTTSHRPAPGFTLTDSAGNRVSLADFRGRAVVLYPNEGVGCGACFEQMADIERHAAEFAEAKVTVLPIVMNPVDSVRAAAREYGITTPYLIDADGAVSKAYGVLGKGMHAGLPGHGFILIDGQGVQRWYGEYPSMYLSSADLLAQIRQHLAA